MYRKFSNDPNQLSKELMDLIAQDIDQFHDAYRSTVSVAHVVSSDALDNTAYRDALANYFELYSSLQRANISVSFDKHEQGHWIMYVEDVDTY